MKRSLMLLLVGLLSANLLFASTSSSTKIKAQSHKSHSVAARIHRKAAHHRKRLPSSTLKTATRFPRVFQTVPVTMPQYSPQSTVNLAPSTPQLTTVDPFANRANPSDPLKPARPFWYSVDKGGLTILSIDGNAVVYKAPWPQTIDIVQPDGSFVTATTPPGGWEPVGMTVSYPTEEQLASNSETPDTYVYVVMARSGYEWQSNPNPPVGRDPNLRDTIVPSTNPATESALLIQVDVTDPTFPPDLYPTGPTFAGALLGHGAGQLAFEPSIGAVYVGNMPSTSLPTTPAVPRDLTSFASVIAAIVAPEAATPSEPPGPPAPPIVLPFESPDVLPKTPYAFPIIAEGGEGPYVWSFTNLPSWLTAHPDKLTGQLDGIIYGTVPASGSWTFQAQVTDVGVDPPVSSPWTDLTLTVNPAAEEQPAGELPFEVGAPNGLALPGTDLNGNPIDPALYTCTPAAISSPGSIVPAWIDVKTVRGGCVVMGTAPISGQYYEFTLSNFKFAYPWDREPVVFSGNVAGPYIFDPLPAGVGLSGLAWHEIDKIHDPSTEADVLNVEFFGVEPFTGQLYRILPPQGALETGQIAPPEISVEIDAVSTYAEVLTTLKTSRKDIADALAANPNLKVKFGDLVVEANRDPNVYVNAGQMLDPTGADPTVIPIGGPTGSTIDTGAVIKVSGTRDPEDPTVITLSAISTINLPGVQAYFPGLDSDLSPAVRGSEPGQVDHGALLLTGTNTGKVAVVDTNAGALSQGLEVPNATSLGGVSVDPGTESAYVAGKLLQSVTIFGTGSPPASRPPKIWSGATTVINVGYASSFTVIATGSPTPTLSRSGTLPKGVTFTDNGNGTATLAGTPATGTEGSYPLTITASNGVPPDAIQAFTLTIGIAPVITSANTTTFNVGYAGSFTVTTTGTPVATLSVLGTLPIGLTFMDNEDGTATLAGTPATGTEGSYPLTITASNGAPPDAVQNFTLIVNGPGGQSLTVTLAGNGSGKVTSSPTGINCPGTCSANFNTGEVVILTATANSGSMFVGWSGSCTGIGTCSVTMNEPKSVTATFNLSGEPAVSLSPLSVSFGTQVINTTSAPKTVTLTNSGTGLLTISSIETSGNFAISSKTCGTTLAVGAKCTVQVSFTPTVVGLLKGALTFSDNAPNSPQSVPLSGTGVLPATLAPASVNYGLQGVGSTSAAKMFTLTNNQTVVLTNIAISTSGDFAMSATTCTSSLAAKAKCTISVTFTPTATGIRTGMLTVTDSASNSPQTASLTGNGVVPATLTPASLTYGLQALNTTTAPKSFTLTNNQSVVLTNIAISTSGDFAMSTTTCTGTLAAKAKCTISVTFTPTAVGIRTGMLTVTDSANNSPQTASLTGTGVVQATLTPVSVSYGLQALNTTSAPKTFTLTNNLNVSLTNIAISTSGDFAMSATTCTGSLAAKAKCTISVTFTPTAVGIRTGMLTVSDSANNSPQTSKLTGTGR